MVRPRRALLVRKTVDWYRDIGFDVLNTWGGMSLRFVRASNP